MQHHDHLTQRRRDSRTNHTLLLEFWRLNSELSQPGPNVAATYRRREAVRAILVERGVFRRLN